MVRNGWPGFKLELPHINGADGAGEVVEIAINPHPRPSPAGERVPKAK
jgi:NADPH:quinone reductase-like Zn-dependent oxidoreductase